MAIGKFHGVIAATTPSGSRRLNSMPSGALGGRTSPPARQPSPPKYRRMSRARRTSPLDSARVLPSSRVSVRATSSRRSVSNSAARKRMAPRAGAGVARQAGNASAAAAAAWAASSAVAAGKTASTSSGSAGFLVSKLAWSLDPTQLPPMRSLHVSIVAPRSRDAVSSPGPTILRTAPAAAVLAAAGAVRAWSGRDLGVRPPEAVRAPGPRGAASLGIPPLGRARRPRPRRARRARPRGRRSRSSAGCRAHARRAGSRPTDT